MTLDYGIILPLMLACVIAHYTAQRGRTGLHLQRITQAQGRGVRAPAARRPARGRPHEDGTRSPCRKSRASRSSPKTSSPTVSTTSTWSARAGSSRVPSPLHDVKSYLNDPELASIVIARGHHARASSLRSAWKNRSPTHSTSFPATTANVSPSRATSPTAPSSAVSRKPDVILALAEQSKPLSSTHEAAVTGEAVEMKDA